MFSKNLHLAVSQIGLIPLSLLGIFLLLMALTFFLLNTMRRLTLALFIAGVACFWLDLVLIQLQVAKVYTVPGDPRYVDYFYLAPRYNHSTRYLAYAGLFILPAIAYWWYVLGRTIDRDRQIVALPRLLKRAQELHQQKNFRAAIASYSTILKLDPRQAKAYQKRGMIRLERGDVDQAVSDFDHSIAIDPLDPETYLQRGLIFVSRDDAVRAIADFSSALGLRPRDVDSHLNRGRLRLKTNDLNGAKSDFRAVLRLTNHPDYTEPARKHLEEMGAGYEETGRFELPEIDESGRTGRLQRPAVPESLRTGRFQRPEVSESLRTGRFQRPQPLVGDGGRTGRFQRPKKWGDYEAPRYPQFTPGESGRTGRFERPQANDSLPAAGWEARPQSRDYVLESIRFEGMPMDEAPRAGHLEPPAETQASPAERSPVPESLSTGQFERPALSSQDKTGRFKRPSLENGSDDSEPLEQPAPTHTAPAEP
jgi:regulator of sirC expression with transglutaminase-like and TPR domain